MARVSLTVQDIPANGGTLDDITFTAADATNDHSFENDGRCLVLVKNDDASSHTVDVISVADEHGRTGDRTITAGAGDICISGPFLPANWNQSGGVVHLDLTDDTSMSLAVVRYKNLK